ncbi:MAG TPA: ABC transporter substrate-binding protein [Kofleriaceae bacterium]|jgi:peptide/nickel transport system substrate-binding protein
MPSRLYAITILAAALSCSPRTRRTPDDTVVVLVETELTTADPRHSLTGYDEKLSKLCVSGLTALDTDDLVVRLDLAASITPIDPLTYDIAIRDDARFADGDPVTAADVVATWKSVLAPNSDSFAHKAMADKYREPEARGDKLVRFHLIERLATFDTDMDFGILDWHHGEPGQLVIGAGPFRLRELTTTSAFLDANPYAQKPPKMPHVEIRAVRDAAARLLMLVGGSADLLQNGMRLDLVNYLADQPRVKVLTDHSTLLTYLMMNNEKGPTHDVRVRQAIAYALDRPAAIQRLLGGHALPATGLLPPWHWAYEGNVTRYDRNLDKARQLLDEAGYPPKEGGVRLHLVYKTSADAFRVAIARVLAAQLGEAGIDVEVRSFEFATFFSDIKKGQYEIASMQTSNITDPDFYYTYFHSSWIPSEKTPDGYNRWRYRNAEVDRLVEAGRHELSKPARLALYSKVQQIVAADVPIVPLWHEDNIALANVDLSGYAITPNARLVGLAGVTKR